MPKLIKRGEWKITIKKNSSRYKDSFSDEVVTPLGNLNPPPLPLKIERLSVEKEKQEPLEKVEYGLVGIRLKETGKGLRGRPEEKEGKRKELLIKERQKELEKLERIKGYDKEEKLMLKERVETKKDRKRIKKLMYYMNWMIHKIKEYEKILKKDAEKPFWISKLKENRILIDLGEDKEINEELKNLGYEVSKYENLMKNKQTPLVSMISELLVKFNDYKKKLEVRNKIIERLKANNKLRLKLRKEKEEERRRVEEEKVKKGRKRLEEEQKKAKEEFKVEEKEKEPKVEEGLIQTEKEEIFEEEEPLEEEREVEEEIEEKKSTLPPPPPASLIEKLKRGREEELLGKAILEEKEEKEIEKAIKEVKKRKLGFIGLKKVFKKELPTEEFPKKRIEIPVEEEISEISKGIKKRFNELAFIKQRIYDARGALTELDLQKARHIYVEIMASYNELSDKDKAKVYNDIKELYDDRKHAEVMFGRK